MLTPASKLSEKASSGYIHMIQASGDGPTFERTVNGLAGWKCDREAVRDRPTSIDHEDLPECCDAIPMFICVPRGRDLYRRDLLCIVYEAGAAVGGQLVQP